jgi:hypothetical protein
MQPVIFERPTENIGNEEIPFWMPIWREFVSLRGTRLVRIVH